MQLTRKSRIVNYAEGGDTSPIYHAAEDLRRDLALVCAPGTEPGADIRLVERDDVPAEGYLIEEQDGALAISASDTLGFIYGLYAVSRELLGVQDFWFWNDQQFSQREGIPVPGGWRLKSEPFAVRYRGWFINDEVLLHTWMVDRKPEKAWEMVFEALLRCGGNMVIPGTDKNARKHRAAAAARGLILTHHHAEPLGAEMFARAYPGLTASFAEHPDKFHVLWTQALAEQSDYRVIWNLGFRGQGDRPFWEDDPQYATPEARGRLMGDLIELQYRLVRGRFPDAVCATNLYGETMELYKEGYLRLPENVIKIWADNGFGAMVTRRQNNHNPRIPSMPQGDGAQGIYYHASFYDLQAANHITMLPNPPEFVEETLQNVLVHGGKDFWLVNCSNVKPHVFTLDLIAGIWRGQNKTAGKELLSYASRYYGAENAATVAECFRAYYQLAVSYGPHPDDHAGEQFANHVLRMLISRYMKDGEREPELQWATDAGTLREQVEWYAALCGQGAVRYESCLQICERSALSMGGSARRLLEDSVLLQTRIYFHCYRGGLLACKALLSAMAGEIQQAFYQAGLAQEEYLSANKAMRSCEHGKWHGFYANECLTDVKQTAWLLGHLMGYLRNLGDGPHFYQWQRDFLYAEEDSRVMLIMNMENHLTDYELFALMKERWQG